MKKILLMKYVYETSSARVLRLSTLAMFAAILTAKALAHPPGACDPDTFQPQDYICDNPTQQYYATCSCTSWNASTGYSGCTVIEGCY
jgi:hypothetical protein